MTGRNNTVTLLPNLTARIPPPGDPPCIAHTPPLVVNFVRFALLLLAISISGAAHAAVPANIAEIIVDNADATGVTITGSWYPSSSVPGFYASNYLYDEPAQRNTTSVRFTPTVAVAGTYEVCLRWRNSATSLASNVPVDIEHAAGTDTLKVNQRVDGGTWVTLGVFPFAAGTGGSVTLRTTGVNGYVIADAVRLTARMPIQSILDNLSPYGVTITDTWYPSTTVEGYYGDNYLYNDPNRPDDVTTVMFAPVIPRAGKYDVFLHWRRPTVELASNVPVDVLHSGIATRVIVNMEQEDGTAWFYLGTYQFTDVPEEEGVIIRTIDVDGYVIADAVMLVEAAPTAGDDEITTPEDTPVTLTVTTNDADAGGRPVRMIAVSPTAMTADDLVLGSVVCLNNSDVCFTPAPNASGTATFTYTVEDDTWQEATGTVTVTVTPVNDPPTFSLRDNPALPEPSPDLSNTEDDGPVSIATFYVDASAGAPDEDAGETLTLTVEVDTPALFAVPPAIDAITGTLTYTLAEDAFGEALVTVRLADDGASTPDDATDAQETTRQFRITVSPVNDPPSFQLPTPVIPAHDEDGGTAGVREIVIANFAQEISAGNDFEEETLTFEVIPSNYDLFEVPPAIDPTTGTLTYTLAPDAFGDATVTVILYDDGASTPDLPDDALDSGTPAAPQFQIGVTPVNDAPVTYPTRYTMREGTTLTGRLLARDIDTTALTFTLTTTPGLTLTDPATGAFAYTPPQDAPGTLNSAEYPFTFTVTDGGAPVDGTLTITVTQVNDLPTVFLTVIPDTPPYYATEDITLSALAFDLVEGDAITTIDYFANGVWLASRTEDTLNEPVIWVNPPAGEQEIVARATDARGGQGISNLEIVTVLMNLPPSARLLQPVAGSTLPSMTAFPFRAMVLDTDAGDEVEEVTFLLTKTGDAPESWERTASRDPLVNGATWAYTPDWSLAIGAYTLAVRATDGRGGTVTTEPITFSITHSTAGVRLLSPCPGATYRPGDTIILTAEATDPHGITGVTFSTADGTTLVAAPGSYDDTVPGNTIWTYAWTAPAGSHALYVDATDREGQTVSTLGTPTTLEVSVATPAVTIVSPASTVTFQGTVPTAVPIRAEVAQLVPGLSVAFTVHRDGDPAAPTPLGGLLTAAPFCVDWTPPQPGTYTLTATACDGEAEGSTTHTVTVAPAPVPSIRLSAPQQATACPVGVTLTLCAEVDQFVGTRPVQVTFYRRKVGEVDAQEIGLAGLVHGHAYVLPWTPAPTDVGSEYLLTARAGDQTSGEVSVTVTNPAPSVFITQPSAEAELLTGVAVVVRAETYDSNAVSNPKPMRFRAMRVVDGVEVEEVWSATADPVVDRREVLWTPQTAGTFHLYAAIDDALTATPQVVGQSSARRVMVGAANVLAPSIAFVSPVFGTAACGTVDGPFILVLKATHPTLTLDATNITVAVTGPDGPHAVGTVSGSQGVFRCTLTPTVAGNYTLRGGLQVNGQEMTYATAQLSVSHSAGVLLTHPGGAITCPINSVLPLGVRQWEPLRPIAATDIAYLFTGPGQPAAPQQVTSWTPTAAGEYTISAMMRHQNAWIVSDGPMPVTVVSDQVEAPTVWLLTPATGQYIYTGETIQCHAEGRGPGGVPADTVVYYHGQEAMTGATWTAAGVGSHTFFARAYFGEDSFDSPPVTIYVQNPAPNVGFETPSSTLPIVTPADVVAVLYAKDFNDAVTRVEIELDGVAIAQAAIIAHAPNYTVVLPDVDPGPHTLTARVWSDDPDPVTASTTFTVINPQPTVRLLEPNDDDQFYTGHPVTLVVDAQDFNGRVTGVDVTLDGVFLQRLTAPYRLRLPALSADTHTLRVVAIDDEDEESAPVEITITVLNATPTADLVQPYAVSLGSGSGDVFTTPVVVPLTARPVDTNGTVQRVRFIVNGLPAADVDGTGPTPFAATLTDLAPGTYSVSMELWDDEGDLNAPAQAAIRANDPVIFTVVNPPPVVRIVAPTACTVNTYGTPPSGSLTLCAEATDSNGRVADVRFVLTPAAGTPLAPVQAARVGTSTLWRANVNNLAPGVYTITAIATDEELVPNPLVPAAESSAESLVVTVANPAPVIILRGPALDPEHPLLSHAVHDVELRVTDANVALDMVEYSWDGTTYTPATRATDCYGSYRVALDDRLPANHDQTFTLHVRATDAGGESQSFEQAIRIVNPAPAVSLLMPADNLLCATPARLTLAAVVFDANEVYDANDPAPLVEFRTVEPEQSIGFGQRLGDGPLWTYQWDNLMGYTGRIKAVVRDRDGHGPAEDPTVAVKIQAPPAIGSTATIKLFKSVQTAGNATTFTDEQTQAPCIGGPRVLVLELTLHPGERLSESVTSLCWQVTDKSDPNLTAAQSTWSPTISLDNAANWWTSATPTITNSPWTASAIIPWGGNTSTVPVTLRTYVDWDTAHAPTQPFIPPMGHNGRHQIQVVANGDATLNRLCFREGEWPAVAQHPEPLFTEVKNLVISNVTSSNGTVDYLKYDPEEGSTYHRPSVSFTVEDGDSDGFTYKAWVMIQPTKDSGAEFLALGDIYGYTYAYLQEDPVALTTTQTLEWEGKINIWDGSDRTHYSLSDADEADWGTYTYDVIVEKYAGSRFVEQFAYKWPYCLTISNDEQEGHRVWKDTREGVDCLRCFYKLYDWVWYHQNQYSNFEEPGDIELVPINGILSEMPSIKGETSIGNKFGENDGLVVYQAPVISNLDGPWRIVFTGEDNCWKYYRRDHQSSRMLAVNQVAETLYGTGLYRFGLNYWGVNNVPTRFMNDQQFQQVADACKSIIENFRGDGTEENAGYVGEYFSQGIKVWRCPAYNCKVLIDARSELDIRVSVQPYRSNIMTAQNRALGNNRIPFDYRAFLRFYETRVTVNRNRSRQNFINYGYARTAFMVQERRENGTFAMENYAMTANTPHGDWASAAYNSPDTRDRWNGWHICFGPLCPIDSSNRILRETLLHEMIHLGIDNLLETETYPAINRNYDAGDGLVDSAAQAILFVLENRDTNIVILENRTVANWNDPVDD